MKTRLGFVSNSSSTSFIIGVKKEAEKCPHCGHVNPSVESIFNYNGTDYGNNESELYGYDIKEQISSLKNCIQSSTDREHALRNGAICKEWFKNTENEITCIVDSIKDYRNQLAFLEDWRTRFSKILFCSIDYHDAYTNEMMQQLQDAGDIEMEEYYAY